MKKQDYIKGLENQEQNEIDTVKQALTPPNKEELKQMRLDKVLSKFSTISRGGLYSKNATAMFYNKEFKTFSLNDELNVISLKTVESLLKDLGEGESI